MKKLFAVLTLSFLVAMSASAQNGEYNKRKVYDKYSLRIDELPKVKYNVWPEVKGAPDVLGFFNAIADSYYIDLWYIAQANLNDDDEIGEAKSVFKVVDRKHGYLRADQFYDPPMWVECCVWRKKDGTKLVALNFCYENDENNQFYVEAHTSDLLFYEYLEAEKLLKPIVPPIEGYSDFSKIRLPREGRNLYTTDNHVLVWNDGRFIYNPAIVETPNSVVDCKPSLEIKLDFSEKAIKEFDDDTRADIWDIVGQGCSFYCGCDIGTQKASSTLPSQGKHSYKAGNIHDLDYSTAWVEGAKGKGIGEWVEYTLPANNPRITEICVVNGIVRTKKAWQENARVKVLDLEVNGKPYAKLHLNNTYTEQWFSVPPIGYSDREHLDGKQPLRLRFIIRDVYPGTKYEDTGITEIYFDGIDVH